MSVIISFINNNPISILALVISLVSLGINYASLKDKRKGEIAKILSDHFTKLLIIKNQLNSIQATYELCLTAQPTMIECDNKYVVLKSIPLFISNMQISLENIESIKDAIKKTQEGNYITSDLLSKLYSINLRMLTLEDSAKNGQEVAHKLIKSIEALQRV